MADVAALLEGIVGWLHGVRRRSGDAAGGLSAAQVHVMSQLSGLAALLQPTVASF